MWWDKKPVVVPEPDPHPDKSLYIGKFYFAEFNPLSNPATQPWVIYHSESAMATKKPDDADVFFVSNRQNAILLVDYFDRCCAANPTKKDDANVVAPLVP